MKKPNLFILGAPKCGTTALAEWLSQHPEIFMSPVKEPHYFSEEHRLTPTLEAYEALFETADPQRHRWVAEASVWHLFSDTAVPNILEYSPDARFIVMVRNPLEMAPSMHEQHRFNGNELVDDFSEALALNDARLLGEKVGMRKDYHPPQHMAYLHSCAIGWQLQRLLRIVQGDRVHVVVHDDMKTSPADVYFAVLRFLRLTEIGLPEFRTVNSAKRRRSFLLDALVLEAARIKERMGLRHRLGVLARLRRWNVVPHRRPSPSVQDSGRMAAGFAADVDILGDLIGCDLSHWLNIERDK